MKGYHKHGATIGGRPTPEYTAWRSAKERCTNQRSKNYRYWGGRGISMCQEWMRSFEAFFNHIGPKLSPQHSLDRYPNNDGNYEPGNVRWATMIEQQRNKRKRGPDIKRRARFRRGTSGRKLNPEQVKQIRARYKVGQIAMQELATEYNVTRANISLIIRREIWPE